MMKTLLYFFLLIVGISVKAQVGINTTNPETTFEVVGKPNDPSHYDGIIPPRITGDQLASKSYSNTKKGAVVFVTSPLIFPGRSSMSASLECIILMVTYGKTLQKKNSRLNTESF
jgi:hypothetical protein